MPGDIGTASSSNVNRIRDPLEITLKKSLSKTRDFNDNLFISSTQRHLQTEDTVELLSSSKEYSCHQHSYAKYKGKLAKRNKKFVSSQGSCQTRSPVQHKCANATVNGAGGSGDAKMGGNLPIPRVVIYPPEQVKLHWRKMMKMGGGLINLGNTCYLNSILQCLTYTAPLVNYILSNEHTCSKNGSCLMCSMQNHVKMALSRCGSYFKPHMILHKLKSIAKHFKHSRQEDAHEFLRFLMEGIQKACYDGHEGLDKLSRETTVINQIFGGFQRSQVLCMKCFARSNTYDPFMDLSLNLRGVNTVEEALAKYVTAEKLDAANAYACEHCHQKTAAKKRFSIHKLPNVLTLQLNRFSFTRMAGKINRHIAFREKLNMRPYMSHWKGGPEDYDLYAVLVHQGSQCRYGHYYCYVRSPSNVWHEMNDTLVRPVPARRVFESQAYILWYLKAQSSPSQPLPKKKLSGSSLQETKPFGKNPAAKPEPELSTVQEKPSGSSPQKGKLTQEKSVPKPKADSCMSQKKPSGSPSQKGMPENGVDDVNTDSRKKPTLKRVNSFPAENPWHVHTFDTATSPSGLSNDSTPSTSRQWSFDADSTPAGMTNKKQQSFSSPWTVTNDHKRPLLISSDSPEAKKRRLSTSVGPSIHSSHVDGVSAKSHKEEKKKKKKKKKKAHMDNVEPAANYPKNETKEDQKTKSLDNGKPSQTTNQDNDTDQVKLNKKQKRKKKKKALKMDEEPAANNPQKKTKKGLKKKYYLANEEPCVTNDHENETDQTQKNKKKKKKKSHTENEVCATKLNYHRSDSDHIGADIMDSHSNEKRNKHRDIHTSDGGSQVVRNGVKQSGSDANDTQKEHSDTERTLQRDDGNVRQSLDTSVPVQAWDHYVKDSLVKKKQGQVSGEGHKHTVTWDGSRNSQVAEELWKKPTVSTWTGEKSWHEIEAEREEKRRKRKSWTDHYNDDIDRGKVKKAKKKHEDIPWAFNPFQKVQDDRNQQKYRWEEDGFDSLNNPLSKISSTVPSMKKAHSDGIFPSQSPNGSFQKRNHAAANFNRGHSSHLQRSQSFY